MTLVTRDSRFTDTHTRNTKTKPKRTSADASSGWPPGTYSFIQQTFRNTF